MKKYILLILIGVIILPIVSKSQDYRDVYTGTYVCKRMCSMLNNNGRGSTYNTDTISITVTKDAADSILQINIKQRILKVKLVNKFMQAYPHRGEHYGGSFFAADSLYFGFTNGLAVLYSYIGGEKIKL